MGLRAAVVVCVSSFLLGSLFTHWSADSLTLWRAPLTDAHLWTAAEYYALLAHRPAPFAAALAAAAVLGAASLLWSLRDGAAGNLMFDGASIFLFATAVAVHARSVLPGLDVYFAALPPHPPPVPFPDALRAPTLALASNNLVCSVALTGVLALQAGRFWAERADVPDDESLAE